MNNYFILRAVAGYLDKEIYSYRIISAYTQEKNKLLIEASGNSNTKLLEFSIEKNYNYLLLKNNFSKAKKNVAGLFEEVYGKKILKTELYNDDRIISIELEDNYGLYFTFFSNNPNCYLTQGKKIINAFKHKEFAYLKELSEVIEPADTKQSLPETFPPELYPGHYYSKLGKLYKKELIFRAGADGSNAADDETKIKLAESLLNELEHPVFLLYDSGETLNLSLIKLKHINTKYSVFENVNELITEYLKISKRKERIDLIRKEKIKKYENTLQNIDKKIKGLNIQIVNSGESQSFRVFGDIILRNLESIKKGDRTFHFNDMNGNAIEIKLKEKLSPTENAQYYFDKYKRQKGSAEILTKKINELEVQKNKIKSEFQNFLQLKDYKSIMKEEEKIEKNKIDETSKFRKFAVNQKYEVWVGKDSVSNDLLTTKYSAPNDLWFHVRGASGSHTVLKLSNKKDVPGKEIISKAASIAAYYSKARNASSVPVAYCEKKYVKKKKGFKEGTVMMEREKVIFVKPELPQT